MKQGGVMTLSAPTKMIWLVSLILAVLGFLGTLVSIPIASVYAFWFVLIGYVLLFLGTILKGF